MKFFKDFLITALIALISIPIGLWMLSRVAFFIVFLIALPWLAVTPLRLFFGGKAFHDEWMTKNSMVFIFSYLVAFSSLMGIGVIAYLAIFLGADKNDVYPFAIFAALIVGIFTLVTLTRKMVEDEILDKRSLNFKEPVLPEQNNAVLKSKVLLDGSDYERAIPVSSVEQEYAWIEANFPKAKRSTQEVVSCREGLMDVLEIQLPDGSIRKVYFDITEILVKWALARTG